MARIKMFFGCWNIYWRLVCFGMVFAYAMKGGGTPFKWKSCHKNVFGSIYHNSVCMCEKDSSRKNVKNFSSSFKKKCSLWSGN